MMAIRVLLDHLVDEENIYVLSLLMANQGKPSVSGPVLLARSINS